MTKDEQLKFLYTILNNISSINVDIWEDVSKSFKTKSLKKGEHLFRVEDKVDDFYFLIKGLARYYYISDNAKEFNKSFAQEPGHLLSSISSVISNDTSPFSVEILSDFTTLYISYKDFMYFGKKYPQWNELTLKIYEKLIIKKEKREADLLILSARQRYEKFLQEYPKIVKLVKHYHIASYLGMTNVALSRIRKDMNLTNVNDKDL